MPWLWNKRTRATPDSSVYIALRISACALNIAGKMAGERRETDFMNRSLDEIAAEMDSSLYDRDERDGHHRPQHRYSPYPADHVPSWRAEKEGGNGVGGGGAASGGDGNRVFVANLNYTVTWQQVKDLLKTGGWALIRVVVWLSWKRLMLTCSWVCVEV